MSINSFQTSINQDKFFFLLANASTINVGNLNTNSISTNTINGANANISSLQTNNLSTTYLETSTLYATEGTVNFLSTNTIEIDGNYLTSDNVGTGGELLLNGIPIATTANLSSIGDWALYPAVSTIQMANYNISNANNIYASNANISNTLTATMGGIRIFSSSNITNSNDIMTNTLETTGSVTIGGTLQVATANFQNILTSSIGNAFGITSRNGTFSTLAVSSFTTPNLYISTIGGATGNFSTLNVSTLITPNLSISSISASTLFAVTAAASTLNVSTINTPSLNVNSITAGTGFFSTINVSTVVTNVSPNLLTSTITTQALTVTTSSALQGTTTVTNMNVTDAAFSNRANFTSGIYTGGANDFGSNALNNPGTLSGDAINAVANFGIGLLADGGGNITTNSAIYLTTSNGGSSAITIAARRNALLAYPVPLSQVNIIAEGNCPNIPVVPLVPYGGAINITAYAGPDPIFPFTPVNPQLTAPGAIHLTAYSKGIFPGLITEAAGSILSYSGLTNPTFGVYGVGYYSALTCLSLTAGISPTTTSYPGTVYLRGDNGTKVVNGLYCDTLNNNSGAPLNISGVGGQYVNLNAVQYIGMGNSPRIDGGGGNSAISNFSSISSDTICVNNLSTTAITLPQLYTSQINIAPVSTIYTEGQPNLTIDANYTTDAFNDKIGNSLNLTASSNINIQSYAVVGGAPGGSVNIQCANNPSVFSINLTGEVYASRTVTAPKVSTLNIQLSSINGAAYVPGGGGGGWVSTAATQLDMNGNPITDNTGFLTLLVSSPTTYTSYTQTSTSIVLLQASGSGYISRNAAGNIIDTATGNIQTQATSTINTVGQTIFTGGVSRTLVGSNIQQPILQYGFVSTTGASGTVTVTIPSHYGTQGSYIPFATMMDSPAAQIFTSSISRGSFIIGWSSGGSGNQLFGWQTIGL